MKLIIIAMMFGGSLDSGASIAIHDMDFSSKENCEAAAQNISKEGGFWKANNGLSAGHYKIITQCVSK